MKNFKYEYLQKCITLYNSLYHEVFIFAHRYTLKRDVVFFTNAAECEILHYILKENKDFEKQNIYMILFFRRKVSLFQTYGGVKKMAIFSTNIFQCKNPIY